VLRRLEAGLRLFMLLLAPALASCASPWEALTGPSADDLARQALDNLDQAAAVHLAGTFTNAGRRFKLDCTVNRGGEAEGAVTVDGRAYRLVLSSGRTFVSGQDFWAAYGDPQVARVYGDGWVVLDAAGVTSLGGVASPCSIGRELRGRPLQLRQEGEAGVQGQSAVQLSDSSGKLYVSAAAPHRLLRIESAPGYRAPDGSSGLRLDFSYPRAVEIAPPSQFIDPANPASFPARYAAESVRVGRCDASGCTLVATVRNLAGPPVGRSTATLKLRGADNGDLGGCTVDLPAIPYEQTQDVSCTVGGTAWSSFYNSGGNRQYFAGASVSNPPYD
jgi:hypothetical protein